MRILSNSEQVLLAVLTKHFAKLPVKEAEKRMQNLIDFVDIEKTLVIGGIGEA